MKFTPTVLYNLIAAAAGKCVQHRVYFRITSVLTDPLNSGVAWTDITSYIDKESINEMWSNVEREVGQTKFDSISLIGLDIPYFRYSVFGAAGATHIEFKIEFQIGFSPSQLAPDIVYAFSGYYDKISPPVWSEREGTVSFKVISADEKGSRVSAETVVTQVINPDVDGSGTAGLTLYNIPGVYVIDANISSFVLKKGIHEITWSYNDGSPTLQLDDGDAVSIPGASGTIELTNGTADPVLAATEKITVYVDLEDAKLFTDATHDIIVTVQGNTLPNTWYQGVWVFDILKILYEKIGLTSYEFDNFTIETYDDRKVTSFYEVPPGGSVYQGKPNCLHWDSVHNLLWIGVGNKVYVRDTATHLYTLAASLPTGNQIAKFFPELLGSDEMWGVAIDASGNTKAFSIYTEYYTLTTYTLTNRGTGDNIKYAARNIAYVAGIGPKGSLLYLNAAGATVCLFNLNTYTETTGYNGLSCDMTCIGFSDGTDYYVQSTDKYIQRIYNSGVSLETIDIAFYIKSACYNAAENKTILSSHSVSSSSLEGDTIQSLNHSTKSVSTLYNNYVCFSPLYNNNKVYCQVWQNISPYAKGLAYIASDTMSTIDPAFLPDAAGANAWLNVHNSLTYDAVTDTYYGLTEGQKLIRFSNIVSMYLECEADFEGQYIIDAIKEIMDGFQLIGTVSPAKKVVVFRRADIDGTPKTSGNTVSLTVNESENIQKEENYIRACTIFTVSNGRADDVSWNGSEFNPGLLGDGVKSGVSSKYIPSALLQDFAIYGYNFFSQNLSLYPIPIANVIMWQYECLDAASVTFTTTKIQKTATGPIYGMGVNKNGGTIFKILLPEA